MELSQEVVLNRDSLETVMVASVYVEAREESWHERKVYDPKVEGQLG